MCEARRRQTDNLLGILVSYSLCPVTWHTIGSRKLKKERAQLNFRGGGNFRLQLLNMHLNFKRLKLIILDAIKIHAGEIVTDRQNENL